MAGHTRTFSPRDRKTYKKTRGLFGIAINDADYLVTREKVVIDENGNKKRKRIWICPFYKTWQSMISRCYGPGTQRRAPAYIGCSVVDQWLTFSVFKSWMETQDWEGKQLDKDILVVGNKVYGPETCVFVTAQTNSFILDMKSKRGDYPIGASLLESGKFSSQCHINGKLTKLGQYDTAEEAHQAWLACKLELAKALADEQTDPRVSKALIDRYENYRET